MIRGLGTDVVELRRIAEALQRQGERLAQRVLAESELAAWAGFGADRQVEYLAGRFAAKEAISKALGTGIGQLSMSSVAIGLGAGGLAIIWGSRHQAEPYSRDPWHVSISHTDSTAFAVAIWEVCT